MRKLAIACLCAIALFSTTPTSAQVDPNVAVEWNREMLDAIENNPARPTVISRCLFIVSASMYDAWTAYDSVAYSTQTEDMLRRPAAEHAQANIDRAVSYAAYRALVHCFPNRQSQFEDMMDSLGYPLSNSTDLSTPAGIGNSAAAAIIASRSDDGSNWQNDFEDDRSRTYRRLYEPINAANPESPRSPGGNNFDRNHWQPLRVANGNLTDIFGNPISDNDDPSTYFDQTFLTPHWGAVTPFALKSGDEFRPPAPPMAGSNRRYVDARGREMTNDESWNMQIDEVLNYSATLNDRRKVIAEFWADGPRSWTPPGHWNEFAGNIAIRDDHTTAESVQMFFALNAAMLDGSIAAWEAKRHYDYIRPASAIRDKYFDQTIMAWAGPDMGTQPILGQNWRPYQALIFVTPPFPEYVSGHSTFSRAGREVLLAFTGTDAFYDGVTRIGADFDGDGEEDFLGAHVVLPGGNMFESTPTRRIELRWNTLLQAANEAGVSRLYGGIHIRDGDIRGRILGRKIGRRVWQKASAFFDPIPGDFKRDGRRDIEDLNVFMEYARANDPRADLNGDGRITYYDFMQMIAMLG